MPGKLWPVGELLTELKHLSSRQYWIEPRPVYAAACLMALALLLVFVVVGGLKEAVVKPPIYKQPVEMEAFIVNAQNNPQADSKAAAIDSKQDKAVQPSVVKQPEGASTPADTPAGPEQNRAGQPDRQKNTVAEAENERIGQETAVANSVQRPVKGEVALAFGWQFHPLYQDWRYHTGVDFAVPAGSEIVAAWSGVVANITDSPRTGLTVEVNNGANTAYYSALASVAVKKGVRVAAGAKIGTAGRSADKPYPHLHLAVKQGDKYIDPLTLLE